VSNVVELAINGNGGAQQVLSVSIKVQKKLYRFNKHELGFLT